MADTETLAQRLAHAGIDSPLVILGAPGSGKTTLLTNRIVHLVTNGAAADSLRLLTPTRSQASSLRDQLGLAVGVATQGPVAMSIQAWCFGLVRADCERRGVPPPTLRSGADVDQDIKAVLDQHELSDSLPDWPSHIGPAVRATGVFRTELRELIARLTEWGLGASDCRAWSDVHPAWSAVADFLDDYVRVVARVRPDEYDAAELLRVATHLVEHSDPADLGVTAMFFDDIQDLSPAATDLVVALHRRGIHVTVAGEPDVAVQTFRGADPEGLMRIAQALGVSPTVLPHVYRHGPTLRTAVSSITARIGTALAGPQRQASPLASDNQTPLRSLSSPTPSREAADIASVLLERHRHAGVDFSDMAIATRRASDIPRLASRLQQFGIPTHQEYRPALGLHAASRELVGWIVAARQPGWLTPDRATALFEGLYGQCDARRLRRLASLLRIIDEAEGYTRRGIDSIIAVCESGDYPPELPRSFQPTLDRIIRVLSAVRGLPGDASATLVTSTAWQAWDVEDDWVSRATALPAPSTFHRESLDQVAALLANAERFAQRHPGVSPDAFFHRVLDNDIAEDVVVSPRERFGVFLATPSALAGDEFDTVVVHGLNDHTWPNTRIRWSLLGAPLVARAMRGQLDDDIDDRRVVIDDELRMAALAVSRARNQVIVTALQSEDATPSPLFAMLAEMAQPVTADHAELQSSRGLVSHLRNQLTQSETTDHDAAGGLALLARHGVAGAHPDQWWGLADESTSQPLFSDSPLSLSPSSLGSLEESPLDWFIDRIAPDDYSAAVGIGSLIHFALEQQPWGDRDSLAALVESRWSELDFDSAWVSAAESRRARGLVVALADYLVSRSRDRVEVVGVEREFAATIDQVLIRGVVDRIERNSDGSLVVVDLKTGRAITNDAEIANHPQLQAYQFALLDRATRTAWEVDGPVAGAWLLFVSSGVGGKPYRLSAQDSMDAAGVEAFEQRVRQAAAVVSQARFVGPKHFGRGGSPVSRHRWQRVRSVTDD